MTKAATIEKPTQEVVVHDAPQPQVPALAHQDADSLMAVITRAASDPNFDVTKLERLMAMQERSRDRAAKAAYDAALAAMQPKLPEVDRRGKIIIRDKNNREEVIQSTPYALWEDINRQIKPILADHGFAISFRTGQAADGKITVTCILSHRDGHREETTMTLMHDSTGSKNSVQAVGSSTSYGKRYTACAMLNITTRGEDDDGKKGGDPGPITDEQADKIRKLIEETKTDVNRFLKWAGAESVPDLRAAKFADAVAMLEAKKSGKAS